MIFNKVIGYILLALGLVIISFTLYESYGIFTDKVSVPLVFKTQTTTGKSGSVSSSDLQKQLDEALKNQINSILPPETFSKILNLISWSILSGILIFGGSQIASLGIKMIL